jgi:hypothetical protein
MQDYAIVRLESINRLHGRREGRLESDTYSVSAILRALEVNHAVKAGE